MNNNRFFTLVLFCNCLTIFVVHANSIHYLTNISVTFSNANLTVFNGTYDECICHMINDSQYVSFNYYLSNKTCHLHHRYDQNESYRIDKRLDTLFVFKSLPSRIVSTCERNPSSRMFSYLYWSFDSTYNDPSQNFTGSPSGNPSFSQSTIKGYGSSLSLAANTMSSLIFYRPFLDLAYQSWTFTVWIYLFNLFDSLTYEIFGQCPMYQARQCFHIFIRSSRLFMGFYYDDVSGIQNLSSSTWYHVAYVYDCVTRTQSLYLNGYLDNSHETFDSYQGTSGSLTIGKIASYSHYFDGLIDELLYVNRAKTPEEILRDATLTFHFSFDNDSIDDLGPLPIIANRVGITNFTDGINDRGLYINSTNMSYFGVNDLVLLGTQGQSFSISIWIRPKYSGNVSIIYISSAKDGGCGWCLTYLGIDNNGSLILFSWDGALINITGPAIPIDQWTHIATSYNQMNGASLYINGTFYTKTSPFVYMPSPSKYYMFIGASLSNRSATHRLLSRQYEGSIDDFRLYSRALTSNEIFDSAKI